MPQQRIPNSMWMFFFQGSRKRWDRNIWLQSPCVIRCDFDQVFGFVFCLASFLFRKFSPQEFQVSKMEVLNLEGLFGRGVGFHFGEYLEFRYLKCVVVQCFRNNKWQLLIKEQGWTLGVVGDDFPLNQRMRKDSTVKTLPMKREGPPT